MKTSLILEPGLRAAAAKRFDREALPHLPSVYSTAFVMTGNAGEAEDLVKDAYARAWRNFDAVPSDRSVSVWLLRLLVGSFSDRQLSPWRAPIVIQAHFVDFDPTLLRDQLESLSCDDVHDALWSLPLELRLALWLVDREGLRYQEAADVMETSKDAIASSLRIARGTMRKGLLERFRTKHCDY